MAQDTDNHSQKKAAAELGASAAAPIKEELKGIMSRVFSRVKAGFLVIGHSTLTSIISM